MSQMQSLVINIKARVLTWTISKERKLSTMMKFTGHVYRGWVWVCIKKSHLQSHAHPRPKEDSAKEQGDVDTYIVIIVTSAADTLGKRDGSCRSWISTRCIQKQRGDLSIDGIVPHSHFRFYWHESAWNSPNYLSMIGNRFETLRCDLFLI
jgi:hypothetical protein